MKRWLFFLFLSVLLWRAAPSSGADVGKLLPVELLLIYEENETVVIETDNALSGYGADWEAALADLHKSAPGTVFMDTADTLLLTEETAVLVPQLSEVLRPSCNVCLLSGEADLKAAAAYLRAHRTERTVLDCCNGKADLPKLISNGGRFYLLGEQRKESS